MQSHSKPSAVFPYRLNQARHNQLIMFVLVASGILICLKSYRLLWTTCIWYESVHRKSTVCSQIHLINQLPFAVAGAVFHCPEQASIYYSWPVLVSTAEFDTALFRCGWEMSNQTSCSRWRSFTYQVGRREQAILCSKCCPAGGVVMPACWYWLHSPLLVNKLHPIVGSWVI